MNPGTANAIGETFAQSCRAADSYLGLLEISWKLGASIAEQATRQTLKVICEAAEEGAKRVDSAFFQAAMLPCVFGTMSLIQLPHHPGWDLLLARTAGSRGGFG
jgi:hypothetical protein